VNCLLFKIWSCKLPSPILSISIHILKIREILTRVVFVEVFSHLPYQTMNIGEVSQLRNWKIVFQYTKTKEKFFFTIRSSECSEFILKSSQLVLPLIEQFLYQLAKNYSFPRGWILFLYFKHRFLYCSIISCSLHCTVDNSWRNRIDSNNLTLSIQYDTYYTKEIRTPIYLLLNSTDRNSRTASACRRVLTMSFISKSSSSIILCTTPPSKSPIQKQMVEFICEVRCRYGNNRAVRLKALNVSGSLNTLKMRSTIRRRDIQSYIQYWERDLEHLDALNRCDSYH